MKVPLNTIQHPDEFPIEFHPNKNTLSKTYSEQTLQLLCHSPQAYPQGTVMDISVPTIGAHAQVTGIVDQCVRDEDHNHYALCLHFPSHDAQMRIRMLEQLCYIQRYRQHILDSEGRELDEQGAALEWIKHYAHLFPCIT